MAGARKRNRKLEPASYWWLRSIVRVQVRHQILVDWNRTLISAEAERITPPGRPGPPLAASLDSLTLRIDMVLYAGLDSGAVTFCS